MEKFTKYIDTIGESRLADMLGCSRQAVNYWKKGRYRPSVQMVKRLVELSKGKLKRSDIRPDIYEK